jgi:uncharacterized damage-inducible protein DinB
MPDAALTATFVEFSRVKLLEHYWPRMRVCVEALSEQELWWRPNDASNSVGNLLLHLDGNGTQWLIEPFGDSGFVRDRASEFASRGGHSRASLVERLDGTMRRVEDTLSRLSAVHLTRSYTIQGFAVTGLEAVYHAVEHFSMHTGQVMYITKQLRGASLDFYRDLDGSGVASGDPRRKP